MALAIRNNKGKISFFRFLVKPSIHPQTLKPTQLQFCEIHQFIFVQTRPGKLLWSLHQVDQEPH